MKIEFAEIKGLPIFKAGKFHGGKVEVTDTDLDEMVASFDATKDAFNRPVKLSHQDTESERSAALGVIDRVFTASVNGIKHVMADLKDVPETMKKAIAERRILDRSIEMYPTFQGKRNVLRAIAFLGGDIPEVKGLPDLRSYVYGEGEEPEHITIEFNEAAPGESGPSKNKSSETINNEVTTMETIKLTIDGKVVEFADSTAVRAHFTSGLVPESDVAGLKKQLATAEAQNHENQVTQLFQEACQPLKNGRVIPPAVIDAAKKLALELPIDLKFSEDGKEITGPEKVKNLLVMFAETGTVKVNEQTNQSDVETPDKDAELLKTFEEMKDGGYIESDMKFEEWKPTQEGVE